MSHFIIKCSCGTVVSQCRCASADKPLTEIDKACGRCHRKLEVTFDALQEMWKIVDSEQRHILLTQQEMKNLEETIRSAYYGEAG